MNAVLVLVNAAGVAGVFLAGAWWLLPLALLGLAAATALAVTDA